jgi:TolB-like protein/DNA-binding SARP family transcriptional activator
LNEFPRIRNSAVSNIASFTSKRRNAARDSAPSPIITHIYLLGTVRAINRPGGENILPAAKKTQAVLAFMCLAQGERLLRSRVAGLIWDRSPERQARDSLRHALNELEGIGTWRCETDHESLRLDTASCWVDAFETPAQSDLLLDDLHGLSSSFDQWLLGERMRFEARWQNALEHELKDLIAGTAAPELRAAAARNLLNVVPTHEFAVRSLMAAFVDMEEPAQAIREYERFRTLIKATHDMPPSAKTTALSEAIRRTCRLGATPLSNGTGLRREPAGPAAGALPLGAAKQADGRPASDLPPSIAVLPFQDLSAGAGHDYVASGLVEDLIEALSRVPGLFVISRLSAAAFGNHGRPPREIGEALGVRYILSGSVRATGDRLRLIFELTDTCAGTVLLASRFDERFSDVLDAQDRLADAVVRAVAPHVRSAELKRIRRKRPEDQGAYDLLLRAQENMHKPNRVAFETAEKLFDAAIAREPGYATALAWRAYWHVMRVGQGWSPDPARDTAQADHFARQAVECDAAEPMAFAVQGHVAAYLHKDFARAFAAFDAALQINPNSARAWLWNAYAHAWIGDGPRAVAKVNRAMALSPYDPLVCAYSGGAAIACLANGQYSRAIEFALRCIRENRAYSAVYKVLIASMVLAGRESEARGYAHQLMLLEPRFTVDEHRRRFPGSTGPLIGPYCEALAAAGIPLSA